jgi:hypothetical protein
MIIAKPTSMGVFPLDVTIPHLHERNASASRAARPFTIRELDKAYVTFKSCTTYTPESWQTGNETPPKDLIVSSI